MESMVKSMGESAHPGYRIDWQTLRDRIDLAAVATRLLGPAPGRRGARGRRLWWSCPLKTHEDRNPSFCVDPEKRRWHCYGCGESGDAAALVMRLEEVKFPDAVAILTGGPSFSGKLRTRPKTEPNSMGFSNRPESAPSGLSEADALALVEAASARLWTPDGADALAYLTGPRRCLTPETIRAARLGWTPPRPGRGCRLDPRGGHPVVPTGTAGAGQDPSPR